MLISLLITIVIAKYNHLKLHPLLQCWWLLPVALVEVIYIVVQISVFRGYYGFLPYASVIKTLSLYVLLLPIVRYKLYAPAVIGSGLILIGTMFNKIAMHANNGFMPAFPTISKWTGYYSDLPLGSYDTIHSIGNANTNLKFLTDYIDIGYCILSPGDLLIHSFTIITIYYTIKQLNQEYIS